MSGDGSGGAVVDPVALKVLLPAIGTLSRWQILKALGDGQPKMVKEIGAETGLGADLVSKHIAILREAGMVVVGQAGMYRIPARFLPQPGVPLVDYGFVTLRLDAVEPA